MAEAPDPLDCPVLVNDGTNYHGILCAIAGGLGYTIGPPAPFFNGLVCIRLADPAPSTLIVFLSGNVQALGPDAVAAERDRRALIRAIAAEVDRRKRHEQNKSRQRTTAK
jgi:hypothetical protein